MRMKKLLVAAASLLVLAGCATPLTPAIEEAPSVASAAAPEGWDAIQQMNGFESYSTGGGVTLLAQRAKGGDVVSVSSRWVSPKFKPGDSEATCGQLADWQDRNAPQFELKGPANVKDQCNQVVAGLVGKPAGNYEINKFTGGKVNLGRYSAGAVLRWDGTDVQIETALIYGQS